MPSAIGVEIINASTDEYSVPQMNGRAPNSPATGSQTSVCQNCQPKWRIDSCDSRNSTTAMAPTMAISRRAKAPVPLRKRTSSDLALERRNIYCTFSCSSAFSSMSTTGWGRRAYPSSGAIFCPSVSAQRRNSCIWRPWVLSSGSS